MKTTIEKCRLIPFVLLIALAGMMMFAGGCARYARNVNTLYEPSTTVRGGSGDLYVVIPPSQQTQSADVKWVIGKVTDDDGKQIDEVFSPRSPAEIFQEAFGLEFRKAGYNVISTTKRSGAEQRVIDLTKSQIDLEQVSDLADIKAKCRVLVGMDVFKGGQLFKRLQYEATSSKTDIKDRDLLATKVLQDAMQSVMLQAVPELNGLLNH